MNRLLLIGLVLLVSGPAMAAPKASSGGSTRQIDQILSCRSLADTAQRLACYDREANAIERAIASKDLVVIDKEKARETKRTLFGFSVPSFGGLLGGDDDEVKQIEGVVKSARIGPEGGWMVTLIDGSTWIQTNDSPIVLEPRPKNKVSIRRAALGSFVMSVNGQPGVKVRRIG